MKKNLIYAFAAVSILSGCRQINEVQTNPTGDSKISFESYLGNQTKGLSKNAFKFGDNIFVYGVKSATAPFLLGAPAEAANPGDPNANPPVPATPALPEVLQTPFSEYVFETEALKGVRMSCLGNNTWDYGNPVVWDDLSATFFAFSPVPIAGGESYGITHGAIADNTIPSISFSVKGGYVDGASATDISNSRPLTKKQVDLLRAFSADNTKDNGKITLTFGHALSMINFAVKANHTVGLLRINEITINNISTKGDLVLANNDRSKAKLDYLGGWSNFAEPKNFAVNLKTEAVSAIPVGPNVIQVNDDDESLLMIPQSLTGVKLQVKYSYSYDGSEWTSYDGGVEINVDLDNIMSHIKPNQRYNFTLNISPGAAIGFSSTVQDWDEQIYETAAAAGVFHTMALKKGDKVSVKTDANWITITPDAGAAVALSTTLYDVAADGVFTFSTTENAVATERTNTIKIKRASGQEFNMNVTQAPATVVVP